MRIALSNDVNGWMADVLFSAGTEVASDSNAIIACAETSLAPAGASPVTDVDAAAASSELVPMLTTCSPMAATTVEIRVITFVCSSIA
ncbi:hypothetical protein MSIMFI_05319 [Mycobacterium simulans]|nr:hypothetical protein MSIMFI_05319 [Mycobacterium simulans]